MSRWREAATRLLRPGLGWLILLTLFCAPALGYIFYTGQKSSAIAYPVFVLSAYTLCGWCAWVPWLVKRIRAAIYAHHLGRRYVTDLAFRGRLALHASTAVNLCYGLWKLGAGIYYRSLWFGAIAVYYLLLTAARALLLRSVRQKMPDMRREYRTARLCGVLLLTLTLALSAMTVQMVVGGRGYAYPGYFIFVMAGYAFYAVAFAVVNLVRFRKLNSPVLSASKVLGLATALVSMLSLQTAMFVAFGGEVQFQRLMNALTGGAVCLMIFGMAVLMTVSANAALKKQSFWGAF